MTISFHVHLYKMTIQVTPIAYVQNRRTEPIDDNWEQITSDIKLADHIPDNTILNLTDFSHLEIIYYFDKLTNEAVVFSGRPRGNVAYPLTGNFGNVKKTNRINWGFAWLN